MTRSLAQIQKQITQLQNAAQAIENRERTDVIKRIHSAITHYSLTADELFSERPRRGRPRKDVATPAVATPRRAAGRLAKKGGKLPAKYADGTGNTWSGRGSTPRWLVAALAEGKTIDQFAL